MGNRLEKSCQCLEIFQLEAVSQQDKDAGMENDLAEENIDFAAMRRTKGAPLSKQESIMFGRIFDHIDKNHDTHVTKDELRKYFSDHFNPLTPDELNEMMDIADIDNNGWVSCEEFKKLAALIERTSHPQAV
eukprot:gnl/MRDRNA2_/MRDRNA2_99670_c0_seq1.p2 gnl/MRDRNA2_/MRDRNA2_99670_c0~~gnl/MRDRNA2_/MRDRNA2_99670_c0_seq1.p2  ORF type:complete len:132 (+),score=35.09 gnl/MRDRNA2_/MRDRNA2_99670_c0_seq1:59-454(+)